MKLSSRVSKLSAKLAVSSLCLFILMALLAFAAAESEQQVSEERAGLQPRFRRQAGAGASLEEPSESNIANAKIQLSGNDMSTAAAHHSKSHGGGKYYMYAEVPKKGAHKWGYKRGNHKHSIEAKESAHKSHVHGYVKWHDKKGKGSHKYEYKHSEHKKKKHY